MGQMINSENKRIVVGISDVKFSKDPNSYLITYSLGSCIGAVAYDPAVRLGGMLHFQLPRLKDHEARLKDKPLMFADSGIQILLNNLEKLGASRDRLVIGIYGGASILKDSDMFKIGIQNTRAAKKVFWQLSLNISKTEVGGNFSRTIRLDIATGKVLVSCTNTQLKSG